MPRGNFEPAMNDTAANLPEYSVTEISMAVKRTVEDNFGYVRVRGEVSGLTRARSGHVYLSLKDDKSVIDAVCWRGTAQKLAHQPEDGLEVICTGRLTTYPARSRYQLVIEAMEPAGVGALLAQLEERRRKLTAEGLFAEERKKPLPYLPEVIGVVTSPTGAVIRDILHRLRDRFPRHVLLWPVLVQGEGAAGQVAAAIRGFNALAPGGPVPRPDLLIVARGGGSIEDLWSFNEEVVVRAAAESEIPLISAVGHETDTTLIDFASDRRAPTPTAAAEIAVPVRAELRGGLSDMERRLRLGAGRLVTERRRQLDGLARGLRGPRDLIAMAQQRLDEAAGRIDRALLSLRGQRQQAFAGIAARLRPGPLRQTIDRRRQDLARAADALVRAERRHIRDAGQRLSGSAKLLDALSFERVLDRGYAVVRDAAGSLVTAAAATTAGQGLNIRFHDGEVAATVDGGSARPHARPAPDPQTTRASRTPKRGGDGGQGDLF
jgi:exodeoxyribonuclease VII large subunit